MEAADPFDLHRFVTAQARYVADSVLDQRKAGIVLHRQAVSVSAVGPLAGESSVCV